MANKVTAFVVGGFENLVTSIAGLLFAVTGALKGIGFDWIITYHSRTFDLNLVLMAISGGILGWAAKQTWSHSTAQEISDSTAAKGEPVSSELPTPTASKS